ncbi:MAG: glycosyltransferase family 9 protein [Ignavibacteria bacterium]|nr:glycosyltransferase family 9 protein [Ignavibacteria bacterium]
MKSILVIRLTSLGDVVLATPIVRMLRSAYPEAKIDVAVDERFSEVWNNNPYVSAVYALPKGREHTIKAQAYDLIIDLQRNRRSGRIIQRLQKVGSPRVLKYAKHLLEKLGLVYFKRKPKHVTHVVHRYAEPLRELGVTIDVGALELWPQANRPGEHVEQPLRERKLRIGIAPGAQHYTKRYPVELIAHIVRDLVTNHAAEVVLLGGPADVELCNAVVDLANVSVARGDGATTLAATVGLLDTLDAVVSCDSAIVHMAAARQVPVAVVYGSTAPEFGFTPYGVSHANVQAHDVPCRPCTHIGRSSCPKGHFRCMHAISPLTLVNEAVRLAIQHAGA